MKNKGLALSESEIEAIKERLKTAATSLNSKEKNWNARAYEESDYFDFGVYYSDAIRFLIEIENGVLKFSGCDGPLLFLDIFKRFDAAIDPFIEEVLTRT